MAKLLSALLCCVVITTCGALAQDGADPAKTTEPSPSLLPVLQIVQFTSQGPVCFGPLGNGPCVNVHQYALANPNVPLKNFRSPDSGGWLDRNPRTVWGVATNGPICAGPQGAGHCLLVQQQMVVLGMAPNSGAVKAPAAPTPGSAQVPALAFPPMTAPAYPQVSDNRLVEERPWGFCPPPCLRR